MVRQSIITLALLHKFVYEFRGNNTCIIQDGKALISLLKFKFFQIMLGDKNATYLCSEIISTLTSYNLLFSETMIVTNRLKEFCQNTTVHGLAFVVDEKSSWFKRLAWLGIFLVCFSYASMTVKQSIDGEYTHL